MAKRNVRMHINNTRDASLRMVLANYEVPLLNASVTTAFRTAGILYVASNVSQNRRLQVYEIEFGQGGSLASTDIQNQWDVSRVGATAALVGTSVTPNLLDPGDTGFGGTYFNNVTTEPTYTTAGNGLSLKQWAINQRGSYRWRALDDGDNIVIPGTQFNGIGVRELSGSANSGQSAIGNMSYTER